MNRIGAFEYAGGLEIRAVTPDVVLELSDLRIGEGGRVFSVSDAGSFFEARLELDGAGRLTGLTDARTIPLVGTRGERLAGRDADAEGLDFLPNGDRLVSFEGAHRIWRYPADGSLPRPVPIPESDFPGNTGMEALTFYPTAATDAYLVGGEEGAIWLCRLSSACRATELGRHVPEGLSPTALAAFGPNGDFALLTRAYDPARGVRISLKLIRTADDPAGRVLDEMTMAPPLSVDNFEGVAVVPDANGLRLYLVADDNGSSTQRTLLLAFDWQANRRD
ncbi:MAG: esterase-like activity of phytase family protein [Vicinamibacterales bacterium]